MTDANLLVLQCDFMTLLFSASLVRSLCIFVYFSGLVLFRYFYPTKTSNGTTVRRAIPISIARGDLNGTYILA